MEVPPRIWKDSFGGKLGMVYEEAEPGHVKASLEVRPEHCNPVGICHGGLITAFADDTTGASLHPLCPDGMVFSTTQLNVHFVRSARPGDRLLAETCVLSQGRRTALVECRVRNGEGKLVALVTSSVLFVEGHLPQDR